MSYDYDLFSPSSFTDSRGSFISIMSCDFFIFMWLKPFVFAITEKFAAHRELFKNIKLQKTLFKI